MFRQLTACCAVLVLVSCGQEAEVKELAQTSDTDVGIDALSLRKCQDSTRLVLTTDDGLATATANFNSQVVPGHYVWARADSTRAYFVTSSIRGCPAPSLEKVVGLLVATENDPTFAEGALVPDLNQASPFFIDAFSTGGPALHQAAEAFGQATAQGWQYSRDNGTCQNCTEFSDRLVVYYGSTRKVVVVDGVHGWDS